MKHLVALVFTALAFTMLSSCSETAIEKSVSQDVEFTLAEEQTKALKEEYCDSLHIVLRKAEKGSKEWKATMQLIQDSCKKIEKPSPCDSLKRKLSTLEKGSDEHKKLMMVIKEKCCDKREKPSPCDSLKRKLNSLEKGSDDYKILLVVIKEKCDDKIETRLEGESNAIKLKESSGDNNQTLLIGGIAGILFGAFMIGR